MPTTANYEWTTPVEGGSTGVWDTILNAAFDDIDEDLFAVDERVDVLETFVLSSGLFISGYDGIPPFISGVAKWDNGVEYANLNVLNSPYRVPLRNLRAGMRITGFESDGAVTGSRTATVALYRVHGAGATEVSSGHAIGGSTTGLTHDVLANNQYFLYVIPAGGSLVSDTTALNWVKVTVIETP
jgi:hypothetical protein